jgi:plasmid stabilization system protein ParE
VIRHVVLRPEAESDIFTSRDWYARQREQLGDDFVQAIDELLAQIQSRPELFAVIFRTVRRAKTRRFPYIVYFRLWDDRTEVVAVLHASRDQRIWKRRI